MTDPTIIRAQTLVQGNLTGEDPVEVEGQLIGQVALQNTLTVQPGGLVRGKIHVRQAIIHGRLEGSLTATERVYLAPSAVVIADLDAPLIRVDDGAKLHGKLLMALDAPLPAVAPLAIKADTPKVEAPKAEPAKPSWSAPASFTSPARPATPAVVAPAVTAPAVTAPVVTTPVPVAAPSFTSTRPVTAAPAAQAAPAEAPRTATTVVEPEPVKVVEPAPVEVVEVVEAPVIAHEVEATEATEVVETVEAAQIIDAAPAHGASEEVEQDAHDDDPAAHMSAEAAKYEHYTVKELREELRRLDLPVSGSKEDLIERLIGAQ
jgi:cytoskeletal protein CcmA (bactofilin family)